MNARQIIEAESPKKIFKSFLRPTYAFKPGDEVISSTADTRDIIEACLATLRRIDPKKYEEEVTSYDLADYLAGNADAPPDIDPHEYLFEHLLDQFMPYCPPFTYFGFLEADGTVGCWPWNDMSIEMAADEGKVTIQDGEEADWNQVDAPYLYLDHTSSGGGRDLYNATTRKLIWSW